MLAVIFTVSCNDSASKNKISKKEKEAQALAKKEDSIKQAKEAEAKKEEEAFKLTDENAIPFFFEYQKKHKENRVKVHTSLGDFVIQLYDETPYHRSNFIYLTKKNYFDNTYFHRVVPDFIIQGGNTDLRSTAEKRMDIGSYLLPPDTKKGYRHDRGTISMPSSDNVNNPHKLASPYEFFIVVSDPGAYHLDGKYTAFGKVVSGMDIVDKINQVPTDDGEWPMKNVIIDSVQILD